MVIDKIANSLKYKNLDENIERVLLFIEKTDFNTIDDGTYELDGKKIYFSINSYDTIDEIDIKWESHKKYTDIQYVFSGKEKMGWTNIENLEIVNKYNETTDCAFYIGKGNYITVKEGYFIIFYPQDAHKPKLIADKAEFVRKAVFKILN